MIARSTAELCEHLARDLEAAGAEGRNFTLKIKTAQFDVEQRSTTLARHISSAADLMRHAEQALLSMVGQPERMAEARVKLRLMGVRMSALRHRERHGALDTFVKPRQAKDGAACVAEAGTGADKREPAGAAAAAEAVPAPVDRTLDAFVRRQRAGLATQEALHAGEDSVPRLPQLPAHVPPPPRPRGLDAFVVRAATAPAPAASPPADHHERRPAASSSARASAGPGHQRGLERVDFAEALGQSHELCDRCGRPLPLDPIEASVHRDAHVAEELDRALNRPQLNAPQPPAQPLKRKATAPPSAGPLMRFIKRAASS